MINRVENCDIFRAWNRIEPRSRKSEFDQVLRAEIADPLWMLARQWQFGEYKGDDGGSPVFAKVEIETTSIARVKAGSAPAQPYNEAQPLEQWAESEAAPRDLRNRAAAGQQWIRILKQKFATLAPSANIQDYIDFASTQFAFQGTVIHPLLDDLPVEVEKTRLSLNSNYMQWLSTLQRRGIDGARLYENLQLDLETTVSSLILQSGHKDAVQASVTAFMAWYKRKYDNAPIQNSAWQPAHLEYQFGVAFPEKNGQNTVLTAKEYYTGHLDWYNFDVNPVNEIPPDLALLIPAAEEKQRNIVKTVIPSAASYAGMPNKRWWEFEDGAVDLGNINAQTTDIAKIVLVEFALIYGNDWFNIPIQLPVGSLSKVNGLVVTDVFGVRTVVRPASQGQSNDWSKWGMFNLSLLQTSMQNAVGQPTDTRLFLPPATARTLEGKPLEKVLFVRDEMANMVWAIEDLLPDHVGGSVDGLAAATLLTNALHQLDGTDAPPPPLSENAILHWQLGNTVPENWIPFIPIHIPGQQRAIRLQRASMPRLFRDIFMATRPQGAILRVGMNNDGPEAAPFVPLKGHVQLSPYFVHEEEVPRSGARIEACHQRTRWYGGRVLNWYGRYKTTGRGEGSSGLRYDTVSYAKRAEE